jgi:hypothetical protein
MAAAVLLGWPWPAKVLALAVVVAHGLARRPAPTPATIIVAADGLFAVPELGTDWLALGPATRLSPYTMLLSLHRGSRRVDILLLIDQLDRNSWARVSARLRRLSATVCDVRRSKEVGRNGLVGGNLR